MGIVKSIDERIGRFGRKRPVHFLMIIWIPLAIIRFISILDEESLLRSILYALGEASLVIVISLAIIQYLSFMKKEIINRNDKKK